MRKTVLLLALLASPAFSERGMSVDANKVTNTPSLLILTIPVRRVVWCILEGGAADETVIFRAVGGTPEYQRVDVAAGATVTVKLGQNVNANNGLEVATLTAAGDVAVSCAVKVQ